MLNTHWDHISDDARQKSAKLIRSRLSKINDGLPTIVMGDLNLPEDAPATKAVDTLVDVAPVYPPEALDNKVQGVVIIEAVIDAQGNVSDTRVLQSVPALDVAAVEAVRQWKFTPTIVNGVAVPAIFTTTVNFRLQ